MKEVLIEDKAMEVLIREFACDYDKYGDFEWALATFMEKIYGEKEEETNG